MVFWSRGTNNLSKIKNKLNLFTSSIFKQMESPNKKLKHEYTDTIYSLKIHLSWCSVLEVCLIIQQKVQNSKSPKKPNLKIKQTQLKFLSCLILSPEKHVQRRVKLQHL